MPIFYRRIDVQLPKIQRRITNFWIKDILSAYQKRVGEVTFVFCSDEEILRINNLYLHHDYYTDIITFDYSQEDVISGDLFISLDTVKSNSIKYETNYFEELRRVMIHGILHLCGFDDKTLENQQVMREEENQLLKRYGI